MPAPKKTRAKVTTPLGRQILQKERLRLAKEQALLGEQFHQQARSRMNAESYLRQKVTPENIAVNRGLVRRVAAVLTSEQVNLPIHTMATEGRFSAWTDFDQIHVTYHLHDDVRLTAAVLRGMLYHEGGHVRFTLPFRTLSQLAREEYRADHGPEAELPEHAEGQTAMQRAWNGLEDQRMETAVVSDSPRKAIYFVPMVLAELMGDPTAAKNNWPLLVWRRYIPRHLRDRARSYFVTQHGADKAIAIEETITRYVTTESALEMWQAVIEMTEHLRHITVPAMFSDHKATGYNHDDRGEKEKASNKLQIPIDPSMLDEETLKEIQEALEAEASKPATPAADESEQDEDDDEGEDEYLPEDPEVEYVLPIVAENDDEGQGQTPVSPQSGDDDEDEEGDDAPADGGAEAPQETSGEAAPSSVESHEEEEDSEPSQGAGSTSPDHDEYEDEDDEEAFQEALTEGLEEAETERYEDKALDGDVQAYETAKWDTESSLLPYNPGVEDDGALLAVAENLAYEIEQTFMANTIDRAPAWVESQRRGVVNVLRYQTRQAGDAEFYRGWVDDDQPGFDIAVSILLDYSGSMDSRTDELAQAGYASKRACDRLGIPCSVILWDTDAKTLWDPSDRADEMPRIATAGGTEPTTALADLENQRLEKAKHLVLIFTDGDWQDWNDGSKSITAYKDPGRYFISFVLDNPHQVNTLLRYGSDEAYAITDLLEIPRRLEQALIENA